MTQIRSERPHTLPLAQRLLARPEAAAELLGVGRSTIYELMRAGALHVVHMGRAARIPVVDPRLWVEAHESAGVYSGHHQQLEARGRHDMRHAVVAQPSSHNRRKSWRGPLQLGK